LATAQAMFLSAHDVAVAVVVAVVSGGVALGLARVLGRVVVADSRALVSAARGWATLTGTTGRRAR